jgi:hypothetical protein
MQYRSLPEFSKLNPTLVSKQVEYIEGSSKLRRDNLLKIVAVSASRLGTISIA